MNFDSLKQLVQDTPLSPLAEFLSDEFISSLNHGDLPRWLDQITQSPDLDASTIDLVNGVNIGSEDDITAADQTALVNVLKLFIPWRKGPFRLFGIDLDTEWRSDMKWNRVVDELGSLDGQNILDVGCGNGYHCLRLAGAGARQVIGIDPHLPYVMQAWLLGKYLPTVPVHVLPIGLEKLPDNLKAFDTVLSMGVLYHRKSPIEHLIQLGSTLKQGGRLVLETLFVDGDLGYALTPTGRYARMSNVWFIPSIATLCSWLEKVGYRDIHVIDQSMTTNEEQRATAWMPYQSLDDSLDKIDLSRTIENHPRPQRVVVSALKRSQ